MTLLEDLDALEKRILSMQAEILDLKRRMETASEYLQIRDFKLETEKE